MLPKDKAVAVLYPETSGWTLIWFMDGATISDVQSPGMVSSDWQIVK
jgi:hypothetical protein